MFRRSDQALFCYCHRRVFLTSLTVEPEDDETELYGKLVSDLQTGVVVGDYSIDGTLNYVSGYTQFSSNPDEQEGHYLALKFTADTGATVKVNFEPSGGKPMVDITSDMYLVARVDGKLNRDLKVTVTSADGATETKFYDLSGLILEDPD